MRVESYPVDLKFNRPQVTTWNWIFDPKTGKPFRRRTVFLPWGRGVGKSYFRRQVWWTLIAQLDGKLRENCPKPLRGVRITSMMPTLKQFKDVHWADIEAELLKGGPWAFLGAKLEKQAGQITFPGGSRVMPFPAMTYSARTARGMRTDVLDVDELDDVESSVYDSIATPWLSEPWSLGLELPGGTPTRGRHGLFWRMLKQARLGRAMRRGEISDADAIKSDVALSISEVFDNLSQEDWPEDLPRDPQQAALSVLKSFYGRHSTYRDAPETVSPLAVARARAQTPTATFNREWNADPDAGEGLVYPFDPDFHIIGAKKCPLKVVPEYTAFYEFHVGVDHGLSDPGVMLLCGVLGHGNDAALVGLEEFYESNVPNSVWDARALAWRHATFWPDPSRSDRILDLRNLGINVQKVDNSILPGIARLAEMLFIRTADTGERFARFYISPKCYDTIREFGLYKRRKHSDGTFDEMPEDKHNHCLEAGALVTTDRGDIPIELVTISDKVLTRAGLRDVLWSGQTGSKRSLWEVETTGGTVVGTPEHRVWTENRGWIRLDAVRYGDMVVTCPPSENRSRSSITGKPLDDTRTPAIPTPPTTGDHNMAGTFTESCGSASAGRSQSTSTSIMWTRTRRTTASIISSVCRVRITSLITAATLAQRAASSVLSTLLGLLRSLPLGTLLPLASTGIRGTARMCSGTIPCAIFDANDAAPISIRPSLPRLGSVRHIARQPTGARVESTTRTALAQSAQSASYAIDTTKREPVLGLALGSRSVDRVADVYDLTVDEEHEFFANGVLVHNSMDSLRYLALGRFGRPQNTRTTVSGS